MGTDKEIQPAVDVRGKSIIQIGLVVHDALKMAKGYSEILGVGPWNFIEGKARDFILHGKTLRNTDCGLRIAIADLGKMQMELIQPLYGPSTHMSFLKEQGEGIHHVSFGAIEDHDLILSGLTAKGIGIEMQGLVGEVSTFTYLATQKALGTIFEVVNPITRPSGPLRPWGTYNNPEGGAVNIEGKEIKQLGIVVQNAEETAKNYWEMLGVGPWMLLDFKPPQLTDVTLHGITVHKDVNLHIKAAIAQWGDLQIELLQPVKGPSTYMEFLKTRGQGIHHLSFDRIEDFDEMISGFHKTGIETESSGLLGGAITFTYLASQKDLGTIFEALKIDSGKRNTLTAYGTWPPVE
jgi:Glyoxalase/Bleomycin resistance protein/Dioxygenase superfamily